MSDFVRCIFYLARHLFAGYLLEMFCSVPGQTLHFILGFIIKLLLQGTPGTCQFDAWRGRGAGPERAAGRGLEQMETRPLPPLPARGWLGGRDPAWRGRRQRLGIVLRSLRVAWPKS